MKLPWELCEDGRGEPALHVVMLDDGVYTCQRLSRGVYGVYYQEGFGLEVVCTDLGRGSWQACRSYAQAHFDDESGIPI